MSGGRGLRSFRVSTARRLPLVIRKPRSASSTTIPSRGAPTTPGSSTSMTSPHSTTTRSVSDPCPLAMLCVPARPYLHYVWLGRGPKQHHTSRKVQLHSFFFLCVSKPKHGYKFFFSIYKCKLTKLYSFFNI
jgi:hypothetical protein